MIHLFTLSLALNVLISLQPNAPQLIQNNLAQSENTVYNNYISDWEAATEWQQDNSGPGVFHYTKLEQPQLTTSILEKGVVVVFAKGYLSNAESSLSKPVSLPFTIFSTNESISEPCQWQVNVTNGTLEIGVQLPEALQSNFNQIKRNVQFRYFLLTDAFLKIHKLTVERLHNMSYQQMANLTGIVP